MREAQLPSNIDAISVGETNVDEHYVRIQIFDHRDSRVGVITLTDDQDTSRGLKDLASSGAQNLVIIDDEHSQKLIVIVSLGYRRTVDHVHNVSPTP